jgi:hypothetical protein
MMTYSTKFRVTKDTAAAAAVNSREETILMNDQSTNLV